jgi:hypothetical protein
MIAGAIAAALFSAPAGAMELKTKNASVANATTAQQTCTGWGVHCETEVTPEYCIAADKCGVALPAASLIRYDQLMDQLAQH